MSISELWKPVRNWEDLYEVSNLGRIRTLERTNSVTNPSSRQFGRSWQVPSKLLTGTRCRNGYIRITLTRGSLKETWTLDELVCDAFLGHKLPGQLVSQKNGDRSDCRLSNLEYKDTQTFAKFLDSEPEVWKLVPKFEEFYELSTYGRLRCFERTIAVQNDPRYPEGRSWIQPEYIREGYLDSAGYLRVGLTGEGLKSSMFMHELVMLVFVGPKPTGTEVLHGDGVKTNCRLSNLRYGTRKDNVADQMRLNENKSRLTICAVKSIREFYNQGGNRVGAVNKFGISYQQANRIYHRVAYTNYQE